MAASNTVEMPRDLVARLVRAVEEATDLNSYVRFELLEDVQAYFPDGIEQKEDDAD